MCIVCFVCLDDPHAQSACLMGLYWQAQCLPTRLAVVIDMMRQNKQQYAVRQQLSGPHLDVAEFTVDWKPNLTYATSTL